MKKFEIPVDENAFDTHVNKTISANQKQKGKLFFNTIH